MNEINDLPPYMRPTHSFQGLILTSFNDEDALAPTLYSDLPYPEYRLVALAHSLLTRGVIGEAELEERLAAVRARLEARTDG